MINRNRWERFAPSTEACHSWSQVYISGVLLHQWPSSQSLNCSHDPGNFLLASRFTSYYQKLSINYISTYLNGAEYGTFDDLMLPIGEGLKAMERLCSSAHWTNRRSLLTLPEGLPMGLFSFLSLRFGLTERSIFFSSTADVFVKAVSRFWSAVYALLVYWWPFLFPPFEYSVKKNRPCRRRATSQFLFFPSSTTHNLIG